MYKFNPQLTTEKAKLLFKEERAINHLEGWFIVKETEQKADEKYSDLAPTRRAAEKFREAVKVLPLSISDNAIFAGTQRDAFARSYALINPSFRVETFAGYCDPTAVYNDIEPNEEFTAERIERVREFSKNTEYVKKLTEVYDKHENFTEEVAFFIEQVTGHIIPDFRPALKYGVDAILEEINKNAEKETDPVRKENFKAFALALESAKTLASRYADIAAGVGECKSSES